MQRADTTSISPAARSTHTRPVAIVPPAVASTRRSTTLVRERKTTPPSLARSNIWADADGQKPGNRPTSCSSASSGSSISRSSSRASPVVAAVVAASTAAAGLGGCSRSTTCQAVVATSSGDRADHGSGSNPPLASSRGDRVDTTATVRPSEIPVNATVSAASLPPTTTMSKLCRRMLIPSSPSARYGSALWASRPVDAETRAKLG